MEKLQLLRQHLLAAIPGLARDPERLLTYVEEGTIQFHPTRAQFAAAPAAYSHEYQFPARIVLTDYSGPLAAVIVPLLQWLNHYEPGLNPAAAVRFDAELLDNQTWDLALAVPLTERVVCTADCASGRIDVEHRIPEYPMDACPAKAWQLWVKGPADAAHQLAAEWEVAL